MRLLMTGIFVVALLGAGAVGAACSTEEPAQTADPALADVVFEGGATPRALGSLLDASPIPDVTRAPTILDPPNNAVLKASQKVVFDWSVDGATALRTAPASAPTLLPPLETKGKGPVPAWLTELLGPERSASAAPGMLDQRGYFLLFSTDSTPRLLRVFTTRTSYSPDAKAWKTLTDAGTWTKLLVVSADFWHDDLVPGTGPFVGASILFCIEPG
jgi:hypothetical protein